MALNVVIPQSPSVTNKTIVTAAAYTANDTAGPFPVDFFSSSEITVVVTTILVGSTLDVYVQKLLPDNVTYDDIYHFAQWTAAIFTTTGTYVASFVNGGNTINQQKAAGLAANTINTVHFGSYWRINFTCTGATFGVYGSFRV